MPHKILYVIIGLLIGIVVMLLGMPVAESQDNIVRGRAIILEDEAGNMTAALLNGEDGPALLVGPAGGAQVFILTSPTGSTVLMGSETNVIGLQSFVGGSSLKMGTADNEIVIETDNESGSLAAGNAKVNWSIMHASGLGGSISTSNSSGITGFLPNVTSTAKVPLTWGQVKQHQDTDMGVSPIAKLTQGDLSEMLHTVKMEYSQVLDRFNY